MRVWTSTENIWWNNMSEDKPSRSYFLQFENRLEQSDNVKVQFINYQNVKIVSNGDNITYLKVEHNDKLYYYYVTGVNRVVNGGYELNLEIDVFTSFTLPFLNNLYDRNIQVKTVRNLYDSDDRLFYTDELLEQVPISYKNVEFKKRVFNVDGEYYYKDNRLQIEKSPETINACIYYRYNQIKLGESGGVPIYRGNIYLPLLSTKDKIKVKINGREQVVDNGEFNLNYLYQNVLVNEFDGIYILPNVLNYSASTFDLDTPIGKMTLLDANIGFNTDTGYIYLPSIDMLPLTPNSNILCDKQMLQYMDIKYFDNKINPEYWGNISTNQFHFNLPDVKTTFAGVGYLNMKVDKLPLSNTQLTLPYKLPSWNDEYRKYVQASYNTVNTSYQIAKQNAIRQSVFGGLGLIGSVASGFTGGFGIAAGIGMGTSALSNIGGGWVSLSQQRALIQAQYKDARTKLQPNITPSNIEDNKFVRYITQNEMYDGVEITNLSASTISQMSNILYYYGYFNPQMNNTKFLLDLKRNNDFTFISLDYEYTKNLINTYGNIFKEFHIDVINDLSGGVRLWDKTPDYN